MQEDKKTRCLACGAHNHGVQTHCLVCQAELVVGDAPAAAPSTAAPKFCTACGTASIPRLALCPTELRGFFTS